VKSDLGEEGMRLLRLVAAFAILGTAFAPAAQAASTQEVDDYVSPAIVYLTSYQRYGVYDTFNERYLPLDEDGSEVVELFGSCTGFVVNPAGYIATAAHCVDTEKYALVAFFEAIDWAVTTGYYTNLSTDEAASKTEEYAKEDWEVRALEDQGSPIEDGVGSVYFESTAHIEGYGARDSEGLPVEVLDYSTLDDGNDVALIRVDASDLSSLLLAPAAPHVGDEAIAIGYAGIVDDATDPNSYNPSFKEGSISALKETDGNPVFEISAAVQHGMSGGPTVNLDGQVLGVNSFAASEEGDNQGFNFIRPSTVLADMLRLNGVTNELAEGQKPLSSGFSTSAIIIGAVAALLVLGGGLLLYGKRKGNARMAPEAVAVRGVPDETSTQVLPRTERGPDVPPNPLAGMTDDVPTTPPGTD